MLLIFGIHRSTLPLETLACHFHTFYLRMNLCWLKFIVFTKLIAMAGHTHAHDEDDAKAHHALSDELHELRV